MTEIPASRAAMGLEKCTGSPLIVTWPPSAWYTPARIFTSVDLPAPFSPNKAWASPANSVMDPLMSALTGPKNFVAPSTTRRGVCAGYSCGVMVASGACARSIAIPPGTHHIDNAHRRSIRVKPGDTAVLHEMSEVGKPYIELLKRVKY